MNNRCLAALLAAVLITAPACKTDTPTEDPEKNKPKTGAIRGVVRLDGPKPAEASLPIKADQKVCGSSVATTRLTLGKDNGVQDAFVSLEGAPAPAAQPPSKATAQILIDQQKCRYSPPALAVRTGSKVEIANSDPILHNVHGSIVDAGSLMTVFNVPQPPVQGERPILQKTMDKPGIVFLSCEAGHPWMSGSIFVSDHPYVAVTGADGSFTIANVPPGTYRLKMWHEGVLLKSNNETLQHYTYEAPYEVVKEVTVESGGEAVVDFGLTIRS